MCVLSLYELNAMVREVVECSLDGRYWITAEVSELRPSARGHCYMELIQRAPNSNNHIARARAVIWANNYGLIKLTFEECTGQRLVAGIEVQLEVSVSFSEAYGFTLVVSDIDPTYTMGSEARKRKEILDRLTQENVINDNKQLLLPRPLRRIAIISSATAAGYGDFCNQLNNNPHGFCFETKLFAATMQGESTARSIIGALDAICEQIDRWDVVVIIRGGGAVSDLSGYEDYDLALSCANFPLPIITGIGHERDTTVIDFVAHTSLKTPTAVAAFLIDKMEEEANFIARAENLIYDYALHRMHQENLKLNEAVSRIRLFAATFRTQHERLLTLRYQHITQRALSVLTRQQLMLQTHAHQLPQLVRRSIRDHFNQLNAAQRTIQLYDPQKILQLGYTITRKNGRIVRQASSLSPGDTLVTTLASGTVESIVK